jgi:hypothetical protein
MKIRLTVLELFREIPLAARISAARLGGRSARQLRLSFPTICGKL